MCTENVKEKTELLHALINGKKLSDLPKINQVMICHYKQLMPVHVFFTVNLISCLLHSVYLTANLDNLGRARSGLSIGTWPTA